MSHGEPPAPGSGRGSAQPGALVRAAPRPVGFTDAEVEALGEGRALAWDGAVDPRGLELGRTDEGLFRAGTGKGRHLDPRVRGDRIRWLEEVPAPLAGWFGALAEALAREAWLRVGEPEVQLAIFEDGAGYARHVDTFRDDPRRLVSAVVYLHERWEPGWGGELELDGGERLAPLPGRVVVFLSDRVGHAVRPAWFRRVAVAAWFPRALS